MSTICRLCVKLCRRSITVISLSQMMNCHHHRGLTYSKTGVIYSFLLSVLTISFIPISSSSSSPPPPSSPHSEKKWLQLEPFCPLHGTPRHWTLKKWFFIIEEPFKKTQKVLVGAFKGARQLLLNSFWFLVEPLGFPCRGQVKNPNWKLLHYISTITLV